MYMGNGASGVEHSTYMGNGASASRGSELKHINSVKLTRQRRVKSEAEPDLPVETRHRRASFGFGGAQERRVRGQPASKEGPARARYIPGLLGVPPSCSTATAS